MTKSKKTKLVMSARSKNHTPYAHAGHVTQKVAIKGKKGKSNHKKVAVKC